MPRSGGLKRRVYDQKTTIEEYVKETQGVARSLDASRFSSLSRAPVHGREKSGYYE